MEKYQCGDCKHSYEKPSIRKCPHPAVNKKLGTHMCVSCCKRCEFNKKFGTGFVCEYGKKGD